MPRKRKRFPVESGGLLEFMQACFDLAFVLKGYAEVILTALSQQRNRPPNRAFGRPIISQLLIDRRSIIFGGSGERNVVNLIGQSAKGSDRYHRVAIAARSELTPGNFQERPALLIFPVRRPCRKESLSETLLSRNKFSAPPGSQSPRNGVIVADL
jgi:hypothetical protein